MFKRIFKKLEHDGDDGGEPPVPEDERLAPVAEGVSEDEDVELLVDVMEGILGPLPIVNPAISPVILFRNRIPELLVQVLE